MRARFHLCIHGCGASVRVCIRACMRSPMRACGTYHGVVPESVDEVSRRLSQVVQESNSSLEVIPGVQQQDVVMGTPELLHLRVPEESIELCNVICLLSRFALKQHFIHAICYHINV